jgi:phage terminase large subunit-like protein
VSQPGTRWAIVAATYGDARDTCVEGESGLLSVLNRYRVVGNYNRSIGEVTLTNGSRIKLFSADEPERLRGPQHHGAWCDELAAWRYPETWDQLQFGLRLGTAPRVVITTTPKPTPLVRGLSERDDVQVTRGSTFDNAQNLSPAALAQLRARYEGTRLGRQELEGELLTDVEGSLWNAADIDDHRVSEAPELVRIVVAVDPAVSSGPDSDETGIVVVGKGSDGHAYVLADRSCRDTPSGWAHRAVHAFEEFGEIGTIVGEKNQGGDLIETTIRSVRPTVPYKGITAKVGKRLRAEPIAALYEQGRVHHVGTYRELEDQMTTWLPDSGVSPDRLDALVHAVAELGLAKGSAADRFLHALAPPCPSCGVPQLPEATTCANCGRPTTGETA